MVNGYLVEPELVLRVSVLLGWPKKNLWRHIQTVSRVVLHVNNKFPKSIPEFGPQVMVYCLIICPFKLSDIFVVI